MKKIFLLSLTVILLFIACKDAKVEKENPDLKIEEAVEGQITLEKVWETDTLLTTCESIIYDEKRDLFYVACINGVSPWVHDGDGFIARVDKKGKIIDQKWVEGMSAPKGMGIKDDVLYVTDIDRMISIDLEEGEIIEKLTFEGAENLNDLTIADDGDIFISDSKLSKIFKVDEGEVELLLQDTSLIGINGVYIFADTLVFASYNEGNMYKIEHGNLQPQFLVSLPVGGDGLEKYKDGFIVSSWGGQVFHLDKEWNITELLNTAEQKINSADIEVIENEDLLLVPTFFDNRVVAYKINNK